MKAPERDREKYEKFLNEAGEDEIAVVRKLTERIIPAIISELLLSEEITKNSQDEEVREAITSYLQNEQLSTMNVAITVCNEFENAIELKQINVAIALAGICLEQLTNEFYQELLLNKYGFSNVEFSSCMKGVSVKDKLTWLCKLTTFRSIDNNIVSSVQKVCNLRNNIVHYKPKIEKISEWDEKKEEKDEFDVYKLIPLIKEVRAIFRETGNIVFPENELAQELFEKIFIENDR